TLKNAIGVRRFIIGSLSLAVLTFVVWITGMLEKRGINILTDIQPWIIAAFVILLVIAYWILEYATKLRRQLTPKLSATFNPQGGSIVMTPVKQQKDGRVTDEWNAVYIRGLVTAESEIAVANCTPFLVSVRKKASTGVFMDTQYVDDLQLPWSMIGHEPITIPKGIRRYFDIIQIDEKSMQPSICTAWPLTLRKLFDDKTSYQ